MSTNFSNKIVLITGATSGIGAATALSFAKQWQCHLILCGRNEARLNDIATQAQSAGATVKTWCLDVRERIKVDEAWQSLDNQWRQVDVLVNNAGLALGLDKVHEGLLSDWDTMIETNVTALLYLVRLIVPTMVAHGKGHIINIGSTAGEAAYAKGAVYCATKSAVNLISEGLRIDLVDTPLRVTNVKPGLVDTGFSRTRFHGDEVRAKQVYQGLQPLTATDVADVVLYAASAPAHVQIAEVMIMPTCQATGAVVHRSE